MLAHRLIERKRDGGRIEPGEWRALALAYAKGHVPEYQMAAVLMACFLRGLDTAETAALTEEIAPADQKMYALRDATATVESIPLIASSIMSKKLAEDLTGLVIDMKRGSGALIPELHRVLELAQVMIKLGADHGCPAVALVTA